MTYTTVSKLKTELGITGSSDDTLLGEKISQAQAWIDAYTGRTFEAATATRYYDESAIEGQVLYLDADLLTVTSLVNGDTAGTAIPAAAYMLLPRNATPKWAIRLKTDYAWQVDPDRWITVAGTWGYSATAPADIEAACRILAAYLYRLKDTQLFEAVSTPELGIVTISRGMPPQVALLLAPYRRWAGR